ncbi:MAG: MATE family efflux transporter [Planctomycetes bacterium]|nr:MATE family efflux transporter [Planctomycetota bacterium]
MITNRELTRRIWNLSWPTVLLSALEASLGLVDLLMVRSLGSEATAAIGVSRQVTFLVNIIVVALASGLIAVVSQAVGANRWGEAVRALQQAFLLLVLIGLPVGAVGAFFSPRLLEMLNANAATIAHAAPYLQISFLGILFAWACVVGATFLRSVGDAVTPLKVAVGVVGLNVPLNYLLIHGAGFVPALGVPGAAWASVISQMFGAIVILILLKRKVRTHVSRDELVFAKQFSFDWPLIGRILRIGAPMALAGLVRNGSRLVFLTIVGAGAMGMTLHAAVGVGMQVRLLSVLPALAFQVATAALVGQAIGRGDFDEAHRLGRRSVEILSLLMAGVVGLIVFFAHPLAAMLIEDQTVAATGAIVLRWFALAQFFSSLNITLQGALMGAGDTLPNLRYTFFTQWILMLPLAWISSAIMAWQLHGPLLAWTLAPAVLLILITRRFSGEKWKNIRT